ERISHSCFQVRPPKRIVTLFRSAAVHGFSTGRWICARSRLRCRLSSRRRSSSTRRWISCSMSWRDLRARVGEGAAEELGLIALSIACLLMSTHRSPNGARAVGSARRQSAAGCCGQSSVVVLHCRPKYTTSVANGNTRLHELRSAGDQETLKLRAERLGFQ